ncbi:MAG TPA: fused MFS/spermidine synthase, partial [Gemmatimonadaceae bacterium]|nr:fused MFS/spermidine synthase [Gemmatimonadaceae bacterium]
MPTSSSTRSSRRSKLSPAKRSDKRGPTNANVPAAPSVAGYALAIFISSSLLFLIEPIAGKRVLPLLGGSAAVWTACLVFFQAALLLGYFLAHWLTSRASHRTQRVVYLSMLVLSLAQLALALRVRLQADTTHPIASVLWLLTLMIGLPFVTLSISSPLLQSWFARARTAAGAGGAGRAYRLYAISNVGSLLALIVYPWLIEPRASLRSQTIAMLAGLALLVIVCLGVVRSQRGLPSPAHPHDTDPGAAIDWRVQLLWISLAACGSLLLCAVTNHISQNVATIPLLWVVPLIAYLLSFVVAFSDERWHPRPMILLAGAAGLAIAADRLYEGDLKTAVPVTIGLYCASLFAACLFCHGELYRRRPAPEQLTRFYFCLAAGGALGAVLVGIVAPMTLTGNYEFVIGLALVAVLGAFVTWDLRPQTPIAALAGAVLMLGLLRRAVKDDRMYSLFRERNFYGTLHVTQDSEHHYHAWERTLYNGIIEHGQQVYRADLDTAPTTYYGRATGVGLAVSLCCGQGPRRIGVIGLGTGTMAAYGRPGDVVRFYDINPAVEPIARRYFTYLGKSKGRVEIVNGDARLSLAAEPPQRYDVLAVDAFSGDAIPVHLITSEALELYLRHIQPNGVIAFHVSNRYLDLAPVVQELADHANLYAVLISSGDDDKRDVFSADWVLVTANQTFVDALRFSKDREDIEVPPALRRWT